MYFVGFKKSQGSKRVVLLFSAETPAHTETEKLKPPNSNRKNGIVGFSDAGFPKVRIMLIY